MSLLEENFETFTIINKMQVDDGYGGVTTQWVDGATFEGAIVYRSGNVARVAQALGSTTDYVLTVRKSIDLDFYTVIRRESDDKIFRLMQNSDDNKTPKGAGLDMRQYPAEEFTLP